MSLVKFPPQNHPNQVGKRGAVAKVDDRGTPPELFDPLNERFQFTIDVAASPHNTKCPRFYTSDDDGLVKPWGQEARVWCNPPYSNLGAWCAKAWAEMDNEYGPDLIVMLLPANRTEQAWWHDHVEPYRDQETTRRAVRVEFIRRRRAFIVPGAERSTIHVPFGVCLVIWERDYPVSTRESW